MAIGGAVGILVFFLFICMLYRKELKRRKNAERRVDSLLVNQSSEVHNVIRVPAGKEKQNIVNKYVDDSNACSICLM